MISARERSSKRKAPATVTGQKTEALSVDVDSLKPEEHSIVLCYPGLDLSSFDSRLSQLRKIGVRGLVLEGLSKVGKYGIIGRGCVSVVVKARLAGYDDLVALKIRRVDANRVDMQRDYELQKLANSIGVGPKAFVATQDLFAMEFVDSVKIGKWFESIRTRTPKKEVRALVKDVLEQCYLLDSHGLDHGELSNPSKHILIRNPETFPGKRKTVIIDYESASTQRRPSNLTAVSAFLFLGGWQSEKLRKVLDLPSGGGSRKKLISMLGDYKSYPRSEALEKIFAYLHL